MKPLWETVKEEVLGEQDFHALESMIVEIRKRQYPVATLVDEATETEVTGRKLLLCSSCEAITFPKLREYGYIVTHELERIEATKVIGQGWDGASAKISDEGELLFLECQQCYDWHRLPDDMEVEWI